MRPEILSTARPSSFRLASFLGLAVGGTLLGLGALLPWAAIVPFEDAQTRGVDVWEGRLALAAGVAVLVAMLALRLLRSRRARLSLALVVVLLALGTGLAAASFSAADAASDAAARETRAGVWVALTGAVAATIGGGVSIAWARSR